MSKFTDVISKVVILPLIFSSFLVSCGSELISNDLPLSLPERQFVEITGQEEQVEHGIFLGVVTTLMPEDRKGLKHQVFMIKITSPKYFGETVKVAHSTDRAPLVPVKPGSQVEIKGDLILSSSPKVLHWTHLSDDDSHPDGYIRLNGKVYN